MMEFDQINFFPQAFTYQEAQENYQNTQEDIYFEKQGSMCAQQETQSIQSQNIDYFNSQNEKNQKKATKKSQKSLMHNMQKHLFKFLKKLIVFKKKPIEQMSQVDICTQEMLKCFLKEKTYTKENLLPLFGQFNQKYFKKSVYSYLLEQYCLTTLIMAKQAAKFLIIDEMKPQKIKQILYESQVQRIQLFKEYIITFREQVLGCKFGSRIKKTSQKKIKHQIECFNVLSLN